MSRGAICGGREGNKWSHHYCRRQWSLVDAEHLRYRQLNAWDAALQALEAATRFLSSAHQIVSHAGEDEQACTWKLSGMRELRFRIEGLGIIDFPRMPDTWKEIALLYTLGEAHYMPPLCAVLQPSHEVNALPRQLLSR